MRPDRGPTAHARNHVCGVIVDSLRRDSRSRRALTLLLIVLLETGIATSDARTP